MRPRKRIYLYSDPARPSGDLSFVLRTIGYAVDEIASAAPDLALIVDGLRPSVDEAFRIAASYPDCPIVVLIRHSSLNGLRYPAQSMLLRDTAPKAHLFERIRVLVRRRRGPKKRSRSSEPHQTAAQA